MKDAYDITQFKKEIFYKKFYNTPDYDSQPDLYSFNLPGQSGSFVIDAELNAHTYPYQAVDIHLDTLKNEFILQDPQGVNYQFKSYTENDTGLTKRDFFKQTRWKTTAEWYLTDIIYPNGSKVEFTYQRTEFSCASFYGTALVRKTDNSLKYIYGDEKKDNYIRLDYISRNYPSKIKYKESELNFIYDSDVDRNQKHSNWRLSRIEVASEGAVRKTICFERDTFPNGNHRLKQVYVQAKPGHKQPIAKFAYLEEPVMPGHMHKGFDHWGYWNQEGDDLLGCPFIPIGGIYPEFGTSRASVLRYTQAQSLKNIEYPGGGSKEIVYGLHVGQDRNKQQMRVCGGLRVEKIIEHDGIGSKPAEYRYSYDGGWVYAHRFNYIKNVLGQSDYDLSSRCLSPISDHYGSPVVYSSVTEHLPNGSSVKYDYVPLNEYDDLFPEKYLVTEDTVRFLGREYNEDFPMINRAWGRNLLQQQTLYDAAGQVVKRTKYEYLIDTANAVHVPGLIPYRCEVDGHRQWCLARYYHICCPVLPKSKTEYAGKANLYCRTDYLYNRRHLPSHVIKRYADGTRITSYTKYNHEYYEKINFEKGSSRFPYLPIEHLVYRNGKLQRAALTIYRTDGYRNLHGQVLELKEPDAAIDSADFNISDRTFRGELIYDSRYTDALIFDDYDNEGNMVSYRKRDGIPMSIVYRSGRSMPLAYVAHARYAPTATERVNEVWFDDFEQETPYSWIWPDYGTTKSGVRGRLTTPLTIPVSNFKPGTYILSYWYQTRDSQKWLQHRSPVTITDRMDSYPVMFPSEAVVIDDASLLPPNALLTSQIAVAGLGKLSETDARGRTVYYEYNGFGLPTRVLDNEHQPLKTYSYDHYNPNFTIPAL